jgi:hypothetical protein
MNTQNEKSGIIVAFHTGRGGSFNNPGHVTYIGDERIADHVRDLFLCYENESKVEDEIREAIEDREPEAGELLELLEKAREDYDSDTAYKELKESGYDLGEKIWVDDNRNPVGLTFAEYEAGVGTIDIDGDFNTTAFKYIEDCSENELWKIYKEGKDYTDAYQWVCKYSIISEEIMIVELRNEIRDNTSLSFDTDLLGTKAFVYSEDDTFGMNIEAKDGALICQELNCEAVRYDSVKALIDYLSKHFPA